MQAVLEALGKRQGPGDTRTGAQRWHDALQLGCELLIRARMVPGRAGAGTQVIARIPLGQRRGMDGGSLAEQAWLHGRAGQPGYLTGKDAETAACDAMVVPVVTGHAGMTVIDRIIELALTAAHEPAEGAGPARPRPLSPRARAVLRCAIARLAIDALSGPAARPCAATHHRLPAPDNPSARWSQFPALTLPAPDPHRLLCLTSLAGHGREAVR